MTSAERSGECEDLLRPEPLDLITHPVDPRVGNPAFDGPECLVPWQAGHRGQLDLFGAPQEPGHVHHQEDIEDE